MALVDLESLGCSTAFTDFVSYGKFTYGGVGAPTINVGGAPYSDNSLQNAGAGGKIGRALPSNYSSWFFGCRAKTHTVSTSANLYTFLDTLGATQMTFVLDSTNNRVVVANGSGTTLGTSANNSLVAAQWNFIEIGAVMAAGVGGSVIVKVNGAQILSVAGVNTVGVANANTASWAFQTNGAVTSMEIAHYYFNDTTGAAPWNTFFGDVRVQFVPPTSNASATFTPNGLAANWQNAAKVPPVPAVDFNSDSTPGDTDLFNTGGMSGTLTQVFGVAVNMLALKSDAGARTMATVLKSGATTAAGTAASPGIAALYFRDIYQTDPNTAAQWTNANVNAAQPGYKIVT